MITLIFVFLVVGTRVSQIFLDLGEQSVKSITYLAVGKLKCSSA